MPDARFQLLGPIDEGNRTAIARAELDAWVAQGLVEYLGETDDVRPFIAAATRGGAAVLSRGLAAHRCSRPRRWPGR